MHRNHNDLDGSNDRTDGGNGLGKVLTAILLLAVTQNWPLKVEIKGFKTGHYLEMKTVPVGLVTAGQQEHVDVLKVSPADENIQFSRSRMVSAPDRRRTWDQSRDYSSVFALSRGKTSHFDHRQGSLGKGVSVSIWPQ